VAHGIVVGPKSSRKKKVDSAPGAGYGLIGGLC
jgi:hypothetical protein